MHTLTLLFVAIAVLTLSAGVMTLFGATQRVYRGFWWWTAAQWVLLAGVLLQLLRETHPSVLLLSELLVLQWPITVLGGLRRFHSRHGLRLPAAVDWLLLAAAGMAWLAACTTQARPMTQLAATSLIAALLHLYVAALATRLEDFRASAALKALLIVTAATAGFHLLRLAGALAEIDEPLARADLLLPGAMVAVVAALLMVFLALLFTYERTEHNLTTVQRRLRYLADIDVLTRIPNRRHFHERASHTLGTIDAEAAALMMFDIDHFKRINDLLGHATGDEALRQVSKCIRRALRAHDIAGRLGGDEFAVLLPDTSVHDAMAVAQRIVTMLADRQVAPRTAPLSLSFGVVQMQTGERLLDALRRADQALYEAKRQGRSRAVVAHGAESEPVFSESRSFGLQPSQ